MSRTIPLSVPVIKGNEWKYVKECLDTGWVSSVGGFVNRFEDLVASYAGCKYAIATTNGTSALHVGLVACGITSGDEVIVPSLTFIATANVVRYCNAEPVFMDCNQDTLCIDTDKLRGFLKNNTYTENNTTYNRETKRPVRAIIPVHLFGHPSDMDSLLELSREYNLIIIEDATESLGSLYRERQTGSFGRAGCFSFNGNKLITTGGGGMVVTDDEALAKNIRHLTTQARSDAVEYDHDAIGYNYRLTNIQAAMGVAQMEQIDEFIAVKRKNAELYRDLISGITEVELLWEIGPVQSNFWYITLKMPPDHRKKLMKHLMSAGIQVRPIWKPLHQLPVYKSSPAYNISNAGVAHDSCINLPCSINISEEDIRYVTDHIAGYFSSSGNSVGKV
ncbi:MAG: LegC family aminotransferase [Nitrospiraceae bacterium]|nr:MAG: LegC family aminotransferase [Nitrospiraceae bacterium]